MRGHRHPGKLLEVVRGLLGCKGFGACLLGGLIANYLPARGDFDAWSTAPDGGAALDLASLDLIQRRNHILEAAIQKLPDASRQLLSTLALLTDSVDYETLKAFNPHLPPEPEEVEKPTIPEERRHRVDRKWMRWEQMSTEQQTGPQKQYEAALARGALVDAFDHALELAWCAGQARADWALALRSLSAPTRPR